MALTAQEETALRAILAERQANAEYKADLAIDHDAMRRGEHNLSPAELAALAAARARLASGAGRTRG